MNPSGPVPSQRPWRQAFPAILLLLAWTVLLYRDTAAAIVTIWLRSETFTHGFLVPPLVLWLVWRQRRSLAALTPRPSGWGLLLFAGAAFGWLLGDLVAVNAVTQLSFVAMLVLLVPALLGAQVARAIAFPLAFMFFAVPFGEFAMPQLMVWTADFTVVALRLTGIPVYREGLQFIIPSGAWSVIEACSGVRYLIASLTVGTLFAYLNYQSTKRRTLFIAVSILVPVVANWLRAYMIVMLGHFSGNKLATGVDHLIYGWVFFGIVIMLMFLIGARWSEPEPALLLAGSTAAGAAVVTAPGAARPLTVAAALTLALLAALPQLARSVLDATSQTGTPRLSAPVALGAEWAAATQPMSEFKPAFDNPSAQVNTAYQSGAQRVGLYIGYYRQQNYNRKLVSSDNVLVRSKDPQWAQVERGAHGIEVAGKPMSLRTAQLRTATLSGSAEGERLTVWQVYWVNGTWTASDMLAKAWGALYRLMGRGDDSAVVILYTAKGPADEGAATLNAFMQANFSALEALLLKTREQRN